jgi:hypothetical protein
MNITKEQLEGLYIGQNLTIRQCAEALGMPTHGGVQWLLKKFNIECRPSGFQVGNRKKGDRPPESHGSWKGGKKIIACTQCEAELLRFPSQILDNNFCDSLCYGKWKSENFQGNGNPNHGNSILSGEANPNWKGGITCEPYAPIWVDKRFKAGIRERDNYECQNPDCRGEVSTLTCHHIDYDKRNCDPKNLITLCVSCNCRANYNRDFWEAGYREIIRIKYQTDEQQIAI